MVGVMETEMALTDVDLNKIQGLIDGSLASSEKRLGARIDGLAGRMDGIEGRMGSMEARLTAKIDQAHKEIVEEVVGDVTGVLGESLDMISDQITGLDTRIDKLRIVSQP